MESRDLPGTVRSIAHIMMPNHLTVRRVQERDAESAPRKTILGEPARVPFGLAQHILRTKREFLGLHHPNNTTILDEHIVRRPRRCGELLDSTPINRC